MQEIFFCGIISIIFLIVFIIAEIMYKKGVDVEFTRKFVHFSGAFVTLIFPFVFKSHWFVLGLGVIFAVIMLVTKRFGMLQSVHGVERKSEGAIYHPIAIYICFLYSMVLNQPWFYVISILILAISDASAALIGKTYGAKEFVVEYGIRKTVEGTITFFLTAFLITHLILLLATPLGRLECVLVAFLISIIAAIFESVSLKGADNLFVPLAVMFILSKNIHPTVWGISFQILVLAAFIIGYYIVMIPYKRIGVSGVLLLGFINYTIWALLGNIYAAILLVVSLVCAKTNYILTHDCDVSDSYRVKPVFYILAVPVTCAFLSDYLGNLVFYPYIASIISEVIIIRTGILKGNLRKGLLITTIISLLVLGVSYVFVK